MPRRMSSSFPVRGDWRNFVSKTLQVHREQGCWAEGDAVRIAALARNDRRGLRLSLLILLILGVSQDSALARPKQVELQWGDLSPLIIDKKVTLQLPDDVTVKGRVLAVRDDGLYIDIKKRNKKKGLPQGTDPDPSRRCTPHPCQEGARCEIPSDINARRCGARRRILGRLRLGGECRIGANGDLRDMAAYHSGTFLLIRPRSGHQVHAHQSSR